MININRIHKSLPRIVDDLCSLCVLMTHRWFSVLHSPTLNVKPLPNGKGLGLANVDVIFKTVPSSSTTTTLFIIKKQLKIVTNVGTPMLPIGNIGQFYDP